MIHKIGRFQIKLAESDRNRRRASRLLPDLCVRAIFLCKLRGIRHKSRNRPSFHWKISKSLLNQPISWRNIWLRLFSFLCSFMIVVRGWAEIGSGKSNLWKKKRKSFFIWTLYLQIIPALSAFFFLIKHVLIEPDIPYIISLIFFSIKFDV
jgi:hypothetical protein